MGNTMSQVQITGTTTEAKKLALSGEVRRVTLALTGLETEVQFTELGHWADAEIVENRALYRFSNDVLKKDQEFLRKLAIHEIAHVVDRWLFDGPRTRNGKLLVHDKVWKRICRLLGDPKATTLM